MYASAPPASRVTLTAGQRAQAKEPRERTRKVTLDPGACGHSGQKTRARREPARTGRRPSPARYARSRGSFQGKQIAVVQDLQSSGSQPPRQWRSHGLLTAGQAIAVQLARVMSGQPRLPWVSELGCSTASSAAIYPIPKLITRSSRWLKRTRRRVARAAPVVGVSQCLIMANTRLSRHYRRCRARRSCR